MKTVVPEACFKRWFLVNAQMQVLGVIMCVLTPYSEGSRCRT
jgi:hypothetical protein